MTFEIHSLFCTPFLETTLDFSDDVVDYISQLEYRRTDIDNGDISVNKNVLDHSFFKDYSVKINSLVDKFVYKIINFDQTKISLERVSSWVNRHHHSDWAQMHMHSNSIVSGVWYLETTDKCGDLYLYPFSNTFGYPLSYPISEYNTFNSECWSFSPTKGNLYLFPSALRHSVGKNNTNLIRSSIAFNYYIRGTVYSEDNLMIL